jgi:exodeoxyribonuclease VII large subunit
MASKRIKDEIGDRIPTLLDLQAMRTRRAPAKSATSRASTAPQLSFDLAPPKLEALPDPSPAPTLYTVRQLIAELRQHVENAYTGLLNVEGEISNCRPAASGHIYFTLKDGDAQLPVVLFRRNAQLLAFKLKDGMAVEVRGRISVYETRGQLQLIAESLRPRGTGALQLAFEQLRDRLRREGLFDRPRKPLPAFPHCVGVVTSPTGAAIRDIVNVVRRRHARLNLLIYPAIMQGAQCPATVAAGIRFFNEAAKNWVPHVSPSRRGMESPQIPRVDLIVLARGGGSFEDLAGFNDEALARAIVASELPVVAAIGHEIDHTIADYVADLRAPTPSAAAELVTAAQHRVEERVQSLERRVLRAGEFHLMRAHQRLQRLSVEQVLARLRDSIGRREQRVDELSLRLTTATERRHRTHSARLAALEARLRRHDPTVRLGLASRRLTAASSRLERLARDLVVTPRSRLERATLRLDALSPLAVLSRGYAIVYLEGAGEQTILHDAAQAQPNRIIRARLAQGSVRALITETTAS